VRDWGVPLLLCGARRELAGTFISFDAFAQLYDTHADAVEVVRARMPCWVHRRMASTPVSVAHARSVVRDACHAWRLSHLQDDARLIVSELATNAIEHAATDFDLTVARTARYLRMAVQDGSVTMPLPASQSPDRDAPPAEGGRGLYIVDEAATHWGITPVAVGKIVWTLLAAGLPTASDADGKRAARMVR
jgi:anti-sigma regulatory factor (Ser/Thr protein kinase)